MEDKLCPLSFSFVVRSASPQLVSPQVAKVQIKVGLPCIKEKCAWWDNTVHQCRILTIQMLLEAILNKKDNAR